MGAQVKDVSFQELANNENYDLVSFRPGSVPGPGSPCRPNKNMLPDAVGGVVTEKVIHHKTGDVTVVTADHGYVKFWKKLTK